MDTIKKQMIAALEAGDLETLKRLKPELAWEIAANNWLESHINPITGKGSVPIANWIKDNPFIGFRE